MCSQPFILSLYHLDVNTLLLHIGLLTPMYQLEVSDRNHYCIQTLIDSKIHTTPIMENFYVFSDQ